MSMIRKTATVVICVLVLFMLCGCARRNGNMADSTKKQTVVLTERQKGILRELGLPEEYEQLNDSQKNGIVKIEMALAYLEDTYEEEFEYDGYVSGGLDGQYVTAKIVGSSPTRYVNVYINYNEDHYEFSDNCREIMAEPEYEKQVAEFMSDYFDPSDFHVYVEISRLKEEGESVIERAVGVPDIMVKGVYNEKEVEEAARAYAGWIAGMKYKNGGGADFRVYKTSEYSTINDYSYKEHYGKELLWLRVTVHSDKSIEVQRFR